MNNVRCLCALLSLLFLLGNAQADCALNEHELTQTSRVFATHDGSSYQLLRKGLVPNNARVYSICHAADIILSTCTANSFNPPLATAGCSQSVSPVVEAIADTSCSYTMYRVGYNVRNVAFLEIYRSCYDRANVKALFTIYMAHTSTSDVDRQIHFTTDRIISGAAASSFLNPKIYERYKRLLTSAQTYFTKGANMYDRGHLTPSLDFAFKESRGQTNKYINLIPQFSTINRGNWKTIENWVRRQLSEGHFDVLKVCTGVFGVLELSAGNIQMFLLDNPNRNPVPKWIYKIVSHISGAHFVFLTYNNAHATTRPMGQVVSSVCLEVPCQNLGLSVRNEGTAGYTFCCDPYDFIARNLPHLTGVC
ncbi:uncharacterized protein LOC117583435 [Drosophila guanche]|uniref:DNA/RNA non-specific endonuclease/pyrophosphatase/phosphodiesterase domain-containing protein n=1 Tax=Drosophila guanche TaxID=7266 RepID=A0A3B0KB50_DROGU|nr:uncharacterized protein LOC117583435 [Drosophila guanche]SPP80798.1 Hypothetical predicted protein [Drosophila guanche]